MKNAMIKRIALVLSILLVFQVFSAYALAEVPLETIPVFPSDSSVTLPDIALPTASPNLDNSDENVKSPILYEDESKRTESAKQFKLTDGSYILATYGTPVHYEENGTWKEFDNTLTLKGGLYQAKNGEVEVSLPTRMGILSDVTLTKGKYTISFSYIPAGESLQKLTETPVENDELTVADKIDMAKEGLIDASTGDIAKIQNPEKKSEKSFDASEFTKEELREAIGKYNSERMSADKITSSVKYNNVEDGVDVEYIVTPKGLKENIVINEKSDRYTYIFTLKAPGLKASKTENGSIELINSTGEVIFVILPPYMEDAKGELSYAVSMELGDGSQVMVKKPIETEKPIIEEPITDESAVAADEEATPQPIEESAEQLETPLAAKKTPAPTLDVAQTDELITITLVADAEWINAEDRAFPVMIDPTVQLPIVSGDIEDASVMSDSASTPHPTDTWLYVGKHNGINRAYVKIKTDSLQSMLPENYVIMNAILQFQEPQPTLPPAISETVYLNLYDCNFSWSSSTLTWNNQPSALQATNPFGSYKVIDYGYYKQTYDSSTHTIDAEIKCGFDITALMKRWAKGGANNGMIIASSNEDTGLLMRMRSSEKWTRPMFIVTYRDNKGLEGYWPYASFGAGNAGTASINEYSGNLVFSRTDIESFGLLLPVSVGHVFNGYLAGKEYANRPEKAGLGWKLTTQQTIKSSTLYGLSGENATKYPLVWEDGDGTEHFLQLYSSIKTPEPDPSSTPIPTPDPIPYAVDEDGLGLSVVEAIKDSKSYYKLYDKNGNYSLFRKGTGNANIDGRVEYSYDNNSNVIQYEYQATSPYMLDKIVDGAGHYLKFSYTSNFLIDITLYSANHFKVEECVFSYTNGRLMEILNTDGTKSTFTYDSNGNLASAKDNNSGYTLEFSYTSESGKERL